MRKIHAMLLAGLIAAALALTACGGGSAEPEPVEQTEILTEFAFDPATLTADPGAEVTMTLTNNGALEHTYVIMELGYTAEAPWDDEDASHVVWEGRVQPGATETFTFNAPTEPGTYQVVCNVPGHIEGGMVGEFTVSGD